MKSGSRRLAVADGIALAASALACILAEISLSAFFLAFFGGILGYRDVGGRLDQGLDALRIGQPCCQVADHAIDERGVHRHIDIPRHVFDLEDIVIRRVPGRRSV